MSFTLTHICRLILLDLTTCGSRYYHNFISSGRLTVDITDAPLLKFMSHYSVDANAEALRSTFVSHEGKETIVVEVNAPTRYHVNYDWMAKEMTKQLKKKASSPLDIWSVYQYLFRAYMTRL